MANPRAAEKQKKRAGARCGAINRSPPTGVSGQRTAGRRWRYAAQHQRRGAIVAQHLQSAHRSRSRRQPG